MGQNSKLIKMAILVVLCLSLTAGFLHADDVPADKIAKMQAAMPDKPVVEPKQPRKLLVFNLCKGYKHESIPCGAKALEIMGKKTGAFTTVNSMDMSVFTPENLKQFDAICFNNTTKLGFEDPALRKTLMDFVRNGGGIVGIHAAVDNFYEWPEAAEMMGGLFDGHPWRANDTVTVRIADPDHQLCKMFAGKGFDVTDEIYQIKKPYSRENLRVLMTIDTTRTDMNKKGIKRKDGDFAISWVRSWGKGRVFYCSLGHNFPIFWDAAIMKYYLGGIQFALGDLDVDTKPSGSAAEVIKNTLEQIKTYQYGQTRKPLTKLTELMRQYYNVTDITAKAEEMFISFLGSDATLPAKQFICRELSIIGTEESVPMLASMLEKEETADIALYALQRIPSATVDKTLRDMLDKTSGLAKVGVINTIGARKDSEAVPALASLIRNADPMIDEAAICALGNIGNSQASEALAKVKERTSGRAKLLALDAYLNCADRFAAQGNEEDALAIYNDLYESEEAAAIRIAALRGKVLIEKADAIDIVIDILKADNLKMRAGAIGLIKDVPGEKVTKALTRQLPRFEAVVQAQVIAALAMRADKAALPAVVKAVKSDEKEVRIAALQALSSLGNDETVKVLSEYAAAASDSSEKQAARSSLYTLKGREIDKAVVDYLANQKDPQVRIELISSAGQRMIADAADVLVDCAKDENKDVSIAALKNIRGIATAKDLPALVDILAMAKTGSQRREAEKTVIAVAGRQKNGLKSQAVLSKLPLIDDPQVKSSFINVLGKIGDDSGLDEVRKALKDSDVEVRKAAIRAMSDWPSPAPLNDLLQVAKTSDDKAQQVLALRGFVRLLAYKSNRTAQQTTQMYEQAMNLATQTSEKKMVLSGLSNMKDVASLQMAVDYLDNKQLQQEAEAAVMKIAAATVAAHPAQTKAALVKLAKVSNNETLRKQAFDMIDGIENYSSYLVNWLISGPYTVDGKDCKALFDTVFAPEKAGDTTAKWQLMRIANDRGKVGIVEIFKVMGGKNRVAYLRNKVWSGKERKVNLETGSDDGIKVWLNGKVVNAKNALRDCKRGDDVVEVQLQQGWNTMLIKVTQNTAGFEACARFRNLDCSSVEGLKVKAE